jgi:hypothetical protein
MIALYPGAFKPPHRGHFEVVKGLLKGNHGGRIYDKESGEEQGKLVLTGQGDKIHPITKVIVMPGGSERNGITKKEALAIWKIYSKYLPGLEVIEGDNNPMFTAKDIAKDNPDTSYYAVTGVRDESDLPDLKRITTFKNTPNVQGLVVPPAKGAEVRATDLRKAVLSGNLDSVTDFFPEELSREELLKIINMLKQSIIAEMMEGKVDHFLENWLKEDYAAAVPTRVTGAQPSADRAKLINLFNYIDKLLPTGFKATFKQDFIKIEPENEQNSSEFDFTPYMGSLLEYMLDQGLKITPLPEVKIKKDLAESQDFFGRTAYYDPNLKEITLYTLNRHPKDVMRSFSHEMIHHVQNLDGRLGNIQTSNTNEDNSLLELEKEAYLLGNITFRNWEDSIKNNG